MTCPAGLHCVFDANRLVAQQETFVSDLIATGFIVIAVRDNISDSATLAGEYLNG